MIGFWELMLWGVAWPALGFAVVGAVGLWLVNRDAREMDRKAAARRPAE